MKKQDKSELTKERILQAALEVFGTNGYTASLNHICDKGISKGLIYHNFKNKDEIYLICIEKSFRAFINYMKEANANYEMGKYMETRLQFFSEHELETRLFFEAVLQPPIHLMEQIKEIRKEFDLLNQDIYKRIIGNISLRPGLKEEEAIEYFTLMQEMYNGYFSSPLFHSISLPELVTKHETGLPKFIDFMLYGIGERRDKR